MKIGSGVLRQFVAECRRAAGEYGLMQCSSGNISCRIGSNHMLISASRSWVSHLKEDQVCICRISDAKCVNGRRPSVESVFHAGILAARADMNVVMHFQTPYATALACRANKVKIDYNIIPEIPFYMGNVGEIPYLKPGSNELADAVIKAMKKHDMIQLAHHGQVTVGHDFSDAIQKAVFFEMVCRMIVVTGYKAQPLPVPAIKGLIRDGNSKSAKAV